MELENYFNFLADADIRVKGTRIGIETILEDYLEGVSPEEIAARYRSLTLEQIFATLTYYLRNLEKVDAYMEAWRQYTDETSKEKDRHPSEVITRLRNIKASKVGLLGSQS